MINVTCDNKIDNGRCRSKKSISRAYLIPDDWVQIKIHVVGSDQITRLFCPECAAKLHVDKKSAHYIRQPERENNLESILYDFIQDTVEEYLEDTQQSDDEKSALLKACRIGLNKDNIELIDPRGKSND